MLSLSKHGFRPGPRRGFILRQALDQGGGRLILFLMLSLPKHGFKHGRVKHQNQQWRNGIHHTNSIEGFWSQLKRSINGTHVHVSRKHLPKYLGEFEYRYNMRGNPEAMFSRLLLSF